MEKSKEWFDITDMKLPSGLIPDTIPIARANGGYTFSSVNEPPITGIWDGQSYVLSVQKENWSYLVCVAGAVSILDFAYQATITRKLKHSACGIVFRESGRGYYQYLINELGQYSFAAFICFSGISRLSQPYWATIVPWTDCPFLNSGEGANRLAVTAIGQDICLYANRKLIHRSTLDWLEGGNLGVVVSTDRWYLDASFSDMQVHVLSYEGYSGDDDGSEE